MPKIGPQEIIFIVIAVGLLAGVILLRNKINKHRESSKQQHP